MTPTRQVLRWPNGSSESSVIIDGSPNEMSSNSEQICRVYDALPLTCGNQLARAASTWARARSTSDLAATRLSAAGSAAASACSSDTATAPAAGAAGVEAGIPARGVAETGATGL